jgi:hypothetical protein
MKNNNKIKKITAVILMISFVFANYSFFVCAESSKSYSVVPEFKFGKDTYYPGDTFTMTLRLLSDDIKNLSTNSVEFVIEYDHFNFELLSNDSEKDIKDSYVKFTKKFNYLNSSDGKYNIRIAYMDIAKYINFKSGANVFKIKFKVKENALPGVKRFVLKPTQLVDKQYEVHHINNDESYVKTLEILTKDSKYPGAFSVFADVKAGHWAKDFIDTLVSRKVIYGVDANNFKPKNYVTRAQFAAFVVRALELDPVDYNGEFKDVKKGDWYDKVVASAVKSGIIAGVGSGKFAPNDLVTREQMCAMIIRAYEYINGIDTKNEVGNYKNRFKDMDKVSKWAQDSVKAANVLGIVNGMTDTRFIPESNALREQAAAIIAKFLKSSDLI